MADALIFEFGADITQFKGNIQQVIDGIKKTRSEIKTAAVEDLPALNKKLAELTEALKKLKSLGLDDPLDGVKKGAKGATVALTNVSQIAQDLPFGFIGIQNNIPGLVQSFGKLSTESGGVISALKAMGGALIGPAGILLGFSLVTSGATFLIQKYGSLGNAIDALFTKQTKFNDVIVRAGESIKEFNKSLITNNELIGQASASQNGQALSARALLAIIVDLTKGEDIRKKALDQLKKLDEERFKNFDIEKGKIEGLEIAVTNYTRALVAQSVASKFVDQVAQTSIELEKQRNALQELYNQIDLLENKYPGLAYETQKYSKELISSQGRIGAGFVQPAKGVLDYIATFKKISEQEGVIQGVVKQLEDLNTATIKAVQSASELASPIKVAEQKAGKAPKTPKAEKEERLYDFLGIPFPKDLVKTFDEYIKKGEKLYNKRNKIVKSGFLKPNISPFQLQKPTLEGLQTEETKARLAELQNIAQGYLRVKDLLQNTFFQPLNSAFETLFTKGTFAIKDFTKALLNSIGQIAAKLAATAIVSGLVSLFAIPFGGAFAAGGLLGGIGNLLGGIGGRAGSANFGGVQGGSFGMSGNVNMVLRGTDLVGSINRTNSQISRVG